MVWTLGDAQILLGYPSTSKDVLVKTCFWGIDGVIGHRSPKDGFRSGAFSEKDLNLGRAAWAGCNYKCVGEIFCNDSHKNLTKFQREFEVVFVGFDFRIHAWIWRRNCAKERSKLLLVIYLFICLTF